MQSMQSLLNSKNKRVGDSKSIYPIHVVDDEDDAIHVETDPAETVKHNFNTLLLYIIKMLMNNTKNPYDGFKVDNYLLFENSDKKALENCSRGQEKRLIDEFNCKTLDEVLDKMYPKPKTTVFKPKISKVEKPVKKTTTVKPTKKEEKPQKEAVIPKKIDSATER